MPLADVIRRWRTDDLTGEQPDIITPRRKRVAEEELARAISEAADLREHHAEVKPAP